jgi:hypothetical protein
VPVVLQPGSSMVPSPPSDRRNRVYFSAEDSEWSEPLRPLCPSSCLTSHCLIGGLGGLLFLLPPLQDPCRLLFQWCLSLSHPRSQRQETKRLLARIVLAVVAVRLPANRCPQGWTAASTWLRLWLMPPSFPVWTLPLHSTSRTPPRMAAAANRDDVEATGSLLTLLSFNAFHRTDFAGMASLYCSMTTAPTLPLSRKSPISPPACPTLLTSPLA